MLLELVFEDLAQKVCLIYINFPMFSMLILEFESYLTTQNFAFDLRGDDEVSEMICKWNKS